MNISLAIFSGRGRFNSAKFYGQMANFSSAVFSGEKVDFNKCHFGNGAEFFDSVFPSSEISKYPGDIPMQFSYSTFEKGSRFIGGTKPLDLGLVSFNAVNLSNLEFINVKWPKKRELLFFTRMRTIDEQMLDKNHNYAEVSAIYNQLRNNFQSKGNFDTASHFIKGEMETRRKGLLNGTTSDRLRSIYLSLSKWLSFYGQSATLPLFVWTPVFIIIFMFLRYIYGVCPTDHPCDIQTKFIDSIAAILQSPRSNPTTNDMDIIERVASLPLIGLGIRNAIKTGFGF